MARILYLSHDTVPPTGGMRTIYTHVAVLRRHGFQAFVVHGRTGFRPEGYPTDIPVVYADAGVPPDPRDILVVPETYIDALDWASLRDLRRIVFCQNHFYSLLSFGARRPGRMWGAETVLCASRSTAAFFAETVGWRDLPVVPCAIDGDLFRPRQKRLAIAMMPRKRPIEAATIQLRFRRRFPRHRDVPFVTIHGLAEQRVAERLGEAAIFLSLAKFEGLGLSALEALSCEALVAGFHGEGGLEFATAENGVWVEEGEIERCVAALADLADRVKASDPSLARIRAAGRATAAAYSAAARDAALVAFWGAMADASRSRPPAVSAPADRAAAPAP